mmetsp:Transcript_21984/g.46755  ORF Transcript_21984/g.46755 Transcript_21984/m.46755 type:complete len:698 (+) Transcript_21984:93-2186(+)
MATSVVEEAADSGEAEAAPVLMEVAPAASEAMEAATAPMEVALAPAQVAPDAPEVAEAAAEAPETEEEARARRIAEALAHSDAPIRPEFLVPRSEWPRRSTPGEGKGDGKGGGAERREGDGGGEPPSKRNKRNHRGMNSAKERQGNSGGVKAVKGFQMCSKLAYLNTCDGSAVAKCPQNHDVASVLAAKLPVIADECPVLRAVGVCPAGLNCRFGGHIVDGKNVDREGVILSPDSEWSQKLPNIGHVIGETNIFSDELRQSLRKRTMDFSRSTDMIKTWTKFQQDRKEQQNLGVEVDDFVGPVIAREKKPLDFAGKSILAPLTTVGNLPFRRLCVKLGADVTVGEMALAGSILEGTQSELALLRRHESEKCFGVQIAGGDVETMTKVAQFVDEHVDCDFLDINCGCPLDEVHRRGAGSRLMSKANHLEGIVRSMSGVLQSKALTLKMRTAHIEENKHNEFNGRYAHRLVPMLEDWGVSAIVLHGRTARQRYTKLADWDYVSECATRRARRTPFIGCGDVMNWEEVEEHCRSHSVDACMIGRGALIKPWLFTEVKERRHWDISASERLDMMRDFSNYGLEHWGSDARGVETTRRFLLEWLSFTHRYVPVGVLEAQLPARINWRPRPYVGRNDLETKLASSNAKDWIEISEMLLGKTPEGFQFLPKHKSASYEPVATGAAAVAAAPAAAEGSEAAAAEV